MAYPIFRDGVVFAGYSDYYNIVLPSNYSRNALPTSYDMPAKDEQNPRTTYHNWLESGGGKVDATELRRRLVQIQLTGVDPDANLPKPTTLNKLSKPMPKKRGAATDKDDDDNFVAVPIKPDIKVPTYVVDQVEAFDESTVKKKASPSASISANQPPANTQQANEQVFDAMTSLAWRDKDEFIMASSALNRVSLTTWQTIYPSMIRLADELFLAIHEKTGALDDAIPDDKYNFLFHIIAKGEAMYYQSIADPDFCLYLLDQYQPLYTMLKKKLHIRGDT
jgi:hypothetical protein